MSLTAYRSKYFKGQTIPNRPIKQTNDEPGGSSTPNEYVGELGMTIVNNKNNVIIPTLITPRDKNTFTKM
jgi:hypothetical protein